MRKRLGCLSIYGVIIALATLVVISGVTLARGGGWFSPGSLNGSAQGEQLGEVKSHAEIGGRCRACHVAPWDTDRMSDRCLACHTDLGQTSQDFHRVMLAEAKQTPCFECHTEHKGTQGELTKMDLGEFPHDQFGFSLLGHQEMDGAPFKCSDCHGDSFTQFDAITCVSCHSDVDVAFVQGHIQLFGRNCLDCHDGVDRFGKGFDHNQLAFELQGEHAGVECEKCHQVASTLAQLQATPQMCISCHQKDDPHKGSLGIECETCHTPADWQQVTFDHALSGFPLTGQHIGLECSKCHFRNADGTVVFRGTPANCYACHQNDDPHRGQFGQDCGFCHSTGGWLPANFNHSKSGFPLTGAHARVSCGQCHKNNIYQGTPSNCSACHAEPAYHQGLFGLNCAGCHSTNAWAPAQYNGPHTFPTGHGRANTCRDCHRNSLNTYTCYTCHDQGEIASKHQEEGIGDYSNCIGCHPTGQKEDGDG